MNKIHIGIYLIVLLISSCNNVLLKPEPVQSVNSILVKIITKQAEDALFQNQTDAAIELHKKAIQLTCDHDKLLQAELYIGLGGCYFENNDIDRTKITILKGLDLFKTGGCKNKSNNSYWTGGQLLLANCYRLQGIYDSSLIHLNELYDEFISFNGAGGGEENNYLLAEIYSWKALVYFDIGDFENSIYSNINAIEIVNEHDGLACISSNNYSHLAKIFALNEEFNKSEIYYLQALKIVNDCYGDSSFYFGRMITELGLVYYETKRFQEAYACFMTTHEILQKNDLAHDLEYAYSHNNLGDVLCDMGQFSQGTGYYYKALQFFEENNFNKETGVVYHNLGNAYAAVGNFNMASMYYNKSLTFSTAAKSTNNLYAAYTYQRLGQLHLKQNNPIKALDYFSNAIYELGAVNGDSLCNDVLSKTELYRSLYYEGLCGLLAFNKYHNRDFLNESLVSFNKAFLLQDNLRNYYNTEHAKQSLSKLSSPLIEYYLLALLGRSGELNKKVENKILETIERSKFTALRSILQSTKQLNNSCVPTQVLMNIDSLTKKIRFYESISLDKLSQIDNKQISYSEGPLFSSIYSLDTLYSSLRRKNLFQTAEQQQHVCYSLTDIKGLLSDSTGIIEYYQGDSIIVVFAINKELHQVFHFFPNDDFKNRLSEFIRSIKLSNIHLISENGKYLYNYLIRPIYPIIKNVSSLIIVPDNNFYDVPFDLLISPEGSKETDFQQQEFLITKYDISYQYALSLWCDKIKFCQKPNTTKYEKKFVGFAPWDHIDIINDTCRNPFTALPFSAKETNSISWLFNNLGFSSFSYVGYKSSEDKIVAELKKSQIVHIASHSITNCNLQNHHILLKVPPLSQVNEKSNSFLLDQSPDFNFIDGQLSLTEIFNLDIKSDLVTLSTCCSGSGEYLAGEGTKSLAQGFYYSGATNILYTLWNVSDQHTYEFMLAFYSYISKGFSYSRALRNAKCDFIKSNLHLPVFWSGYFLIG